MVKKIVTLDIKDGLHARPASEIIQFLRSFTSTVKMKYGKKEANCKSMISLLALGIKTKAEVELQLEGTDAEQELQSFANFLENL